MSTNTVRLHHIINTYVDDWHNELDLNPDLLTPDHLFQHNAIMNTLAIIRRTAESPTLSLDDINTLTEAARIIIKDNPVQNNV